MRLTKSMRLAKPLPSLEAQHWLDAFLEERWSFEFEGHVLPRIVRPNVGFYRILETLEEHLPSTGINFVLWKVVHARQRAWRPDNFLSIRTFYGNPTRTLLEINPCPNSCLGDEDVVSYYFALTGLIEHTNFTESTSHDGWRPD